MKLLVTAFIAFALVGAWLPTAATAEGAAVLKVNPKRVNFGTRPLGTFTIKGSTITNVSSSDVLVQTGAVRMPDQFSWGLLEGQTCPIFSPEILAPGASCEIVAGFRPQEFWVGLEDFAVLQVTATDPSTGAEIAAVQVEFRGVAKN